MHAETPNVSASPRKVTSVVRVDARTGRLVRTVVVSPKAVTPRIIAGNPAGNLPPTGDDAAGFDAMVDETARSYGLDPALVHSIIKVESNYNPYAVSAKGAQGLMQLIPATARRLGVRNSFNARENVDAGVRYYKYLKGLFGDDRLARAAYNAGEGAVARYHFNIPPYPETVNYVYRVGKQWGETARKQKASPAVTAPPQTAQAPPAGEHRKLVMIEDDQGRIFMGTARQ